MNLIESAVSHLRDSAIDRAAKESQIVIDRVLNDLSENNWDAQICAPFPSSRDSDFVRGKSKYELYRMLTSRQDDMSRRPHSPDIRKVNQKLQDQFIENAKRDAGIQYDAFVAKLVAKVGEVTEATLDGEHVWGYSILTVKKPDGEVQRWKTQMIINVSKLNKLFNQWPTRKVK